MDKSNTNKNPIKITFLEISPPLNELIKNKEELNIIFQGNDNFYDLKKYLSTKTPIQLSRYKKSLIITLIKSNNILAAGLFTIRPGETNVILNYENKKKIVSTKKVNINNLIECIKIKLLCEYDNKDKEKDKSNISLVNENKNNDSASKYVPKVNLMKNNQLHSYKNKTNNNNLAKKVYEKKNKYLGNFYSNNSYKKNTINNSHEFSMGGDFSSYLTEEMSNLKKNINNLNTSEVKKLNPYSSSRFYNNLTHKTETEKQSKAKNQLINKAKSKNYFSTMKKQAFGNKRIHLYEKEIKNNPDGSKFNIDYPKISSLLKSLTGLSLDYPKDLYKCAYFLFGVPPPASYNPIEKKIMDYNKIDVIFAFGQKDWMDRTGAYRLSKFNPNRYKVFTISNGGHSFSRQNPEELSMIIEEYFPQ